MKKRLLLTRTKKDDIANQYLYVYSDEIIKEAESRGWNADIVEDENNTGNEIESRLKKTSPDFVFFNGHGTPASIHGHKNDKVIDVKSASLLKEKVVYARSCDALSELGTEAVNKGCKAFIGYKGKFLIPRTNEYESTPAKDKTARPVLQVSNIIGKRLLKGATVQKAIDDTQSRARELMLEMLGSEEPYDAATFKALYRNYSLLSFEGDARATA